MLGAMDATQAIADLLEISPQVRDVVVIGADGTAQGSNVADEAAVSRLTDGARRLVEAAEAFRPGVAQLEAATLTGSVFVVRDAGPTASAFGLHRPRAPPSAKRPPSRRSGS